MIRVRLDLAGETPPQILEAYDSPNDKSLEDIAHIIVRAVDLTKFAASNDNQEKFREDSIGSPVAQEGVCKTITTGELPDILTAKHIAEHLHLSLRRVYELLDLSVAAGGIPAFTIGRSKRATKTDYLKRDEILTILWYKVIPVKKRGNSPV